MKIEFGQINGDRLAPGAVFFLYGNYKKTLGVFCDFLMEKFREKSMELEVSFVSVPECLRLINSQYDLFNTRVRCFCIANLEDSHLEKLLPILKEKNTVFILESGDYRKSQKISDSFIKSREFLAIASFKNDLTLKSLCRMLLPSAGQNISSEIIKIINKTDENLSSIFKKISLLLEDGGVDLLTEYSVYRASFLDDLELIPLIRLLLQATVKEKILGKSQSYLGFDLSKSALVEYMLDAEIRQKHGMDLPKSYIYNKLVSQHEKTPEEA